MSNWAKLQEDLMGKPVFAWNGKLVYLVSLTGGQEGAPVAFYINGKVAGQSVYHVGTNQRVDLSIRVKRIDMIKILYSGRR